jgi:hypothetical protein
MWITRYNAETCEPVQKDVPLTAQQFHAISRGTPVEHAAPNLSEEDKDFLRMPTREQAYPVTPIG